MEMSVFEIYKVNFAFGLFLGLLCGWCITNLVDLISDIKKKRKKGENNV